MILDNEPDIVRAISRRLKDKGYRCLTAVRAMEAMAHCTQNPVDLIITDLRMPGLDGEGVVSLVRSVSNLPIIILTGCSESQMAHLRTDARMDVLHKPFEFDALLGLIEQRIDAAPAQTGGYAHA